MKDIANYQGKINAVGKYFVNSHNVRPGNEKRGDAAQGSLTSPPFEVKHPFIEFWIGGGNHVDGTQLQLLVDDKVVRKANGPNNNQMVRAHWDVTELQGKQARIQAIDRRSDGWGNIGFDHIVFTDQPQAPSQRPLGAPTAADRKIIAEAAERHGVKSKQVEHWSRVLLDASRKPDHPLHVISLLANGADPKKGIEAALAWLQETSGAKIGEDTHIVADFGEGRQLWSDGAGYRRVAAGDIDWHGDPAHIRVAALGHAALREPFAKLRLKGGVQREPGALGRWDRAGKTLRTASFELTSPHVHYLIQGDCQVQAVVDSHRTILGPLHGALVQSFAAGNKPSWRWVTHRLDAYVGHRVHIEFSPKGDEPIRVARVAVGKAPTAPTAGFSIAQQLNRELEQTLGERSGSRSSQGERSGSRSSQGERSGSRSSQGAEEDAILKSVARAMEEALKEAKREGAGQAPASRAEKHLWLAAFSAHALTSQKTEFPARRAYQELRQELVEQIQLESMTAPAMWDGSAENELLLIRGNPATPADFVHRRSLTALGGEPIEQSGSGRYGVGQ